MPKPYTGGETYALTGAEILSLNDRDVVERVEVPEWGGHVLVGAMTGRDRDRFERECLEATQADRAAPDDVRAKLAIACCIDAEGAPLFAQSDIDAVALKSSIALDRIYEVCLRINAMSDADIEEITEK